MKRAITPNIIDKIYLFVLYRKHAIVFVSLSTRSTPPWLLAKGEPGSQTNPQRRSFFEELRVKRNEIEHEEQP